MLWGAQASSADADWQSLQSLLQPVAPPASGAPAPTVVAQQAAFFQQAAQSAKSFYTAHPADTRAPSAMKLEALLALQCVQSGGAQYQTAALALAGAYRSNPALPSQDRIDVAMAMEVIPLTLYGPLQGKTLDESPATAIALADKLHGEFGDVPGVFHLYRGILRSAAPADAAALAQRLLGMNAPDWVQTVAQQVLARQALIGRPFPPTLTDVNGRTLRLWGPTHEPTAVILWSNRAGLNDLGALARCKSGIVAGARIVYVSLQSDLTTVAAAQAQAPLLPASFCFETAGVDGLTGRLLALTQLPCVYVVNPSGSVAGYGRLEDLPALLAAAKG